MRTRKNIASICLMLLVLITMQVQAEEDFIIFCQHESHSVTQSEALSIANKQLQLSSYVCSLFFGTTIEQPKLCDIDPSQIETRVNRISTGEYCAWVIAFQHKSSIHHTCGICYLINADSGEVIMSDSGFMRQLRSIWGEHYGTENDSEWPYETRCLFDLLFSCASDKLVMPDESDIPMDEAIQIARSIFIAEGAVPTELDEDFHLFIQLFEGDRAGYSSRVWYISYVYNERREDKGTGWGIFIDSRTGQSFGLSDPDTFG